MATNRLSNGWPGTGGSGPAAGVIAINNTCAVGALKNYFPRFEGVEFIFASPLGNVMKVHSTPAVIEYNTYCWLFQRNLQKIGAHKTDGWCTQIRDENPIYFDREEKCVLLLILLELTKSEFNQCLADAKHEAPDYADSIQRFPLTMLLQHTLCSGMSDYWPAKALDWIDASSDILPELTDALAYATGNKALSQSLRHRARRMWRISQRTQPMHRDHALAVGEI